MESPAMRAFRIPLLVLAVSLGGAGNLGAAISLVLNPAVMFGDATNASCALVFLGGRGQYYDEHADELPGPGEVIAPSFGDELLAFGHVIEHTRELKAQQEKIPRYWEKMSEVEAAGFLREYLVVHRNRVPGDDVKATLKLDAFRAWSKRHLNRIRHDEVDSYGSIANGE